MKRILACLLAGCILLGLMTALQINPELLPEDNILVERNPDAVNQQAL
ncbi:MAG: hypothetical protein IIU00_01925 [Clostridia bacterium]|nr:hypothetical protein [Clostridia bacterium]